MKKALIGATLLCSSSVLLLYCLLSIVAVHAQTLAEAPSLVASASPAPDLTIASVTFSPTQPGAGATGDIVVVVKNRGAALAAGFHVYLYVDKGNMPPTQSISPTAKLFFNIALAPNDVFVWSRTGQRFTTAPPKVYVWVDPPWENRVTEADETNNLFPQPGAAITALSPNRAQAGAALTVAIEASGTHFLNGVTTAGMDGAITVATISVLSSTQAVLALAIDPAAVTGTHTLTLTTGAERISKPAAFTVTAPAWPVITQVQPASTPPSTVLTVTPTGLNTHFRNGQTLIDFGAALTVTAVTVVSPTQAQAALIVPATAASGWHTVTVSTADEVVSKTNGFYVDAISQSALLSVDPLSATLVVSELHTLAVVLAPGTAAVNQFVIDGQVDPDYLRLTAVVSNSLVAPGAVHFDPTSGAFHIASNIISTSLAAPLSVLTMTVMPRQATKGEATLIDLTHDTRLSGPGGSITPTIHNGQRRIMQADQQAHLHGRVDLQGRPFAPHQSWALPLTVDLLPVEQQTAPSEQTLMLDERGRFTIENLPSGGYTIRLKGRHTLATRVEKIELHSGQNELYLGTLLEGDVETTLTHNQVVLTDFSLLSGAFQRCRPEQGFLANADLNEDGCITIEDSTLVYANFNRAGDLVYDITKGIPAPLPPPERLAQVVFITTTSVATVGEELFLPLYIDPHGGDAILALTVDLKFDPQFLEVIGMKLNGVLPYILPLVIDNKAGVVRFSAQALPNGDGIRTRVEAATLQVKLKKSTSGARVEVVVGKQRATNLMGYHGSVLASATGITLISSDLAALPYHVLLPVVRR